MVYQPIVELSSGRIVGLEALARFPGEPGRSPDAWFVEAAEVGLGAQLQAAALRMALSALDRLPVDIFLSVNVDPRDWPHGAPGGPRGMARGTDRHRAHGTLCGERLPAAS